MVAIFPWRENYDDCQKLESWWREWNMLTVRLINVEFVCFWVAWFVSDQFCSAQFENNRIYDRWPIWSADAMHTGRWSVFSRNCFSASGHHMMTWRRRNFASKSTCCGGWEYFHLVSLWSYCLGRQRALGIELLSFHQTEQTTRHAWSRTPLAVFTTLLITRYVIPRRSSFYQERITWKMPPLLCIWKTWLSFVLDMVWWT